MDTPVPCQTHSAELVISTAQQQANVGDAIEINVTLRNTGCATLGLPRYYLMVEQEPNLPALLPQEIAPVDHSLAVPPEGSDQATFLLQAAAPGNATLSAIVSFEAHLGYPGPAYWATASSEKATIQVSAREAETSTWALYSDAASGIRFEYPALFDQPAYANCQVTKQALDGQVIYRMGSISTLAVVPAAGRGISDYIKDLEDFLANYRRHPRLQPAWLASQD